MQAALIAAHNAGDTAAASAIAAAIRSAQAEATAGLAAPSQTAPEGGVSVDTAAADELSQNISGGVLGLRNGLSMGLIDNLKGAVIGGLGGGIATPDGGVDMFNYGTPTGDRYASIRDQVRDENATAQAEAPGPYMAGNIVGGTATSAALMPNATGATILGTGAKMFGLGALEGGLLGYGYADGQDELANTLWGAALGGTTGLLAPAAVAGARAVGRPVAGMIDAGLGRASTGRASVALDRTLSRSGMTLDDLDNAIRAAQADGQPQFVTADALGNPGQRALSGVARAPGDGRNAIVDFLQQRQSGQQDRVGGFLSEALDTPDTAAVRRLQGEAVRGNDASVNYNAARDAAVPVDIRGALDIIDTRLAPLAGVDIQGRPIDSLLSQYRARLAVPASSLPAGTNSIELSDFSRVFEIKKDLHDDIQAAVRAGRGNEAGILRNLQTSLDDALADASKPYSLARDTYREQSRAIEAIDQGQQAARPGVRQQDAVDAYSRLAPQQSQAPQGLLAAPNANNLPAVAGQPSAPMQSTPDAQAGFRAGYINPLMARIENARPSNNAAGALTTPKNQDMLARMADDPALLLRRIERENTMFDTGFAALGGSKTADNLADAVDMEGIDLGLLGNLLQGRYGAAAAQLAQKGANAAKGMNEETRNLIAQALLSSDPRAALAPLLRRAMLVNRTASTAEAAIRQSAFQGLLAN